MNANPDTVFRLRRLGLRALASLPLLGSAAWAAQNQRLQTPTDDWGPFYPPDWQGEIDTDLTRFGGRQARGAVLLLRGEVTDTDGRPVPDAVVELWQADAGGRYRHPGIPESLRDGGFQGFGRAGTDGAGRYAFRTVVPGRYGSRPPHLHLRVARPGYAELVTQMYFRGDNREGGSGFLPPARERLTVDLSPLPAGGFAARFDLVLGRN